MATVRGRAEVKRYLLQRAPEQLEKLLIGAGRAGGKVIAEEAKRLSISDLVSDAIKVRVKDVKGKVTVAVGIRKRWPRAIGIWLEYGTSPHFISVDESQRDGRSIGRINKEGTLAINGKPIGKTVYHPGARAHPFLRVSLDHKITEAVAAAQSYIEARIGHNNGPALDDEGDDA